MDNGHLPQRGEPPQGSVLQMDTDKSVLHPNEKRYIIPWTSQVWINQSIPDSELETFEAAEGGGYFMIKTSELSVPFYPKIRRYTGAAHGE
ncbi:hypothetical protein SD81_035160 [Tolypothrix campylonemoides VB511288]|nr:hypothetical protein SD81_035160 [Tolypothrix campylonemoides VB511288]